MKKLLAIILSLVMIFSLSACGEQSTDNGWYTEGEIKITKSQAKKIISGDFTTPKNIILIIGDGMGPNDIKITEEYSEEMFSFGLVMNLIVNCGFATTHSADSDITDSAASATALSTGVKTNNGYIGKDPEGNDLKTMAELAREMGKKVGIITNEEFYGATPTSFAIHNMTRSSTKELANQMISFKPDVLMGTDYDQIFVLCNDEERAMLENDYVCAKDFSRFKETLESDPNCEKAFIGFNEPYSTIASNNLAQCAEAAFNRLKNDNGFFLMIEGAGADKYGHGNDINGKIASVVTLDRAIAAALLFMKDNPDTLLVITSDHETGGAKEPTGNEKFLSDLLTTTEHTDTPVRVFAVGQGSEYFKGKTVDNTDIAKFLIKAIKGE